MEGSLALESFATDTTFRGRHLLNRDHLEVTDLEQMIMNCAVDAKLSKTQWDEMFAAVGAEKIGDILELLADDYNKCNFKPVLKRRLEKFQSLLYERHWQFFSGDMDVEDENFDEHWNSVEAAHISGDAAPGNIPPPPPQLVLNFGHLCQKHKPSKNRANRPKYWFFNAVSHGCQPCVKILVEDMGVDKDELSDTQGFSAMDFADWFKQPEMKVYLATL